MEEVAKVASDGISDYELQKVKNQLAADKYRRLEDPFFLLIQLLYYDGLKDWRTMDSSYESVEVVTAEQVKDVAERHLLAETAASKLYDRKADAEPEDPELAAFDAATQAQVKGMLGQMAGANAEQLSQGLAQLEQMRGQVPPDAQPAIDYLIKRVTAMLEEAK